MVGMEQNVVLHRSLVADQSQVGFHPLHSVLALGVGDYTAARMLLDLVPDLEFLVLGVIDGSAQLDSVTLPGRFLPGRVRFEQGISGMFLKDTLQPA